jgi:hypothetical protein
MATGKLLSLNKIKYEQHIRTKQPHRVALPAIRKKTNGDTGDTADTSATAEADATGEPEKKSGTGRD